MRDDDDEYQALVATTPRKTYTMPDAWIGDRAEALWKVSISFAFVTEEMLRGREDRSHFATILEMDMDHLLDLPEDDPKRLKRERAIEVVSIQIEEFDNMIWAAGEAIRRLAKRVDLQPEELVAYAPAQWKQRLDWERHPYPAGDTFDEENLQKLIDTYYKWFSHQWPDKEVRNECA